MSQTRDDPTTSEMRHDWLTDRWVIVAPQRSSRPVDFVKHPTSAISGQNCPFCFGHENQTPDAVVCYYEHTEHTGVAGWRVRVVPNKFPAVQGSVLGRTSASGAEISDRCANGIGDSLSETTGFEDGPDYVTAGLEKEADDAARSMWAVSASPLEGVSDQLQSADLFRRRDLTGGHEVIIEGPHHFHSLTQLDRLTTRLVFQAYRDRLYHWLVNHSIAYAVVFKNVGYQAGASLVHSHSQLIATDILPSDVARVAGRMELFYSQNGKCLLCQTLRDELDQLARIVEETTDFVAYCPFASRLPSLLTIVPRAHASQFELLPDSHIDQLSWLVHRLVRRLEHCFPEASYNYVIYTAPRVQQGTAWFHWRIELFPRLSTLAGFEWGSECFINPQTPEAAARQLRLAGV